MMQLAVCDSPAGRLGLTVCYDLRFPEMYQRLAFERGAEVLLVPSAFTRATGEGRALPEEHMGIGPCVRLKLDCSACIFPLRGEVQWASHTADVQVQSCTWR